MDRKVELEKKRKRLDEIRRLRELKKQEKEAEQAIKAKATQPDPGATDESAKERKDVHDLVESLLGPTTTVRSTSPGLPLGGAGGDEGRSSSAADQSTTGETEKLSKKAQPPRLSVAVLATTNIQPKETVVYAKETQTLESSFVDDESDREEETKPTPRPDIEDEPLGVVLEKDKKHEPAPSVPELSDEAKMEIMKSDTFLQFFDKTTRIVERALSYGVDVTEDYGGDLNEDAESAVGNLSKLQAGPCFLDEKWSRHRSVTSISWSQNVKEVFLSSHNMNEEARFDPDGVVLLWNLKYKSTAPEFVFHCQSAVMSATFTSFHPKLVIGGTYSGQIVLWDLRSNKRTPVQRSPLSANAHTHPVYSLSVVGTQNAHNLISVSTDGKMCSWSVDMLSQPQDKLELQYQTKPIACLCMDFLPGDIREFLVGSEEGVVFQGTRLGSKTGVHKQYEGHCAPVTGLHINPVSGRGTSYNNLFLTSSFDWTVKLWSQKMKMSKALYSFEVFSDYVYDVKWSPQHPGLFATVDGMNKLSLWNLISDTETPMCSEIVDSHLAPNCLHWSGDGHHIAVGDADGKIHMYNLSENAANPSHQDFDAMNYLVREMEERDEQPDEPSSVV